MDSYWFMLYSKLIFYYSMLFLDTLGMNLDTWQVKKNCVIWYQYHLLCTGVWTKPTISHYYHYYSKNERLLLCRLVVINFIREVVVFLMRTYKQNWVSKFGGIHYSFRVQYWQPLRTITFFALGHCKNLFHHNLRCF